MDWETYNRQAGVWSKGNIFGWLIGGLGYNWYVSELASLSTILLIFPGIFIASFASIPTYLIESAKNKALDSMLTRRRAGIKRVWDIPTLLVSSAWWILEMVYPYALAIAFLMILHSFFP